MANTDSDPAQAQLAENIKLVDREIRDSYSAAAVEDIKPIAARDFAAVGHQMSDSELQAYATAVAEGADFNFSRA